MADSADGKPFDPSKYALTLPDLIRGNEAMLKGRRLILTFKKGGRIKDEHVYYSDDHDWENQYAISMIFTLACQGINELGPHIIGKGIIGLAPWQDPQKVLGEFHKYDGKKDEMPAALKAEQLDISTPMRIVDYVELPDGTIKIDVH